MPRILNRFVLTDSPQQGSHHDPVVRSAAFYRSVVELTRDLLIVLREDASIVYANPGFLTYSGISDRHLRQAWISVIHPEDVGVLLDRLENARQALRYAEPQEFELSVRMRRVQDASYRWHLARFRSLTKSDRASFDAITLTSGSEANVEANAESDGMSDAGQDSGVLWIGTLTDINDQRSFVETISASLSARGSSGDSESLEDVSLEDVSLDSDRVKKLDLTSGDVPSNDTNGAIHSPQARRLLQASLPVMVLRLRSDGSVIETNEAWLEYTGETREEALSTRWEKLLHVGDKLKWTRNLTRPLPTASAQSARRPSSARSLAPAPREVLSSQEASASHESTSEADIPNERQANAFADSDGEETGTLRAEWTQEVRVKDLNGSYRWMLANAKRVIGSDEILLVLTDIDEVHRTAEIHHYLAEVVGWFADAPSFEELYQKLAQLAVPAFADMCMVELLEDQDAVAMSRRVAIAHVDPKVSEALNAELMKSGHALRVSASPIRTFHSGKIEFIPVSEQVLQKLGGSWQMLQLLRRTGIRWAASIPLVIGDRLIGALLLCHTVGGIGRGVFTAAQLSAITTYSTIAGKALSRLKQDSQLREQSERVQQESRTAVQTAHALTEAVEAMPALVWVVQPDGSAEFFNRAWYLYTGLVKEQSAQSLWLSSIHLADRASFQDEWQAGLMSDREFQIRTRLVDASGEPRFFDLYVRPQCEEHRKVTQWVVTAHDVEEQQRMQERELMLAAIMESLQVHVSTGEHARAERQSSELFLGRAARVLAERFRALVYVTLVNDAGGFDTVSVMLGSSLGFSSAHTAELLTTVRMFPELGKTHQYGYPRVIKTGRSQLFQHLSPQLRKRIAATLEHQEMLDNIGARSLLTVPLRRGESVFGAITMIRVEHPEHGAHRPVKDGAFTSADLDIAESAASYIATFFEVVQTMSRT